MRSRGHDPRVTFVYTQIGLKISDVLIILPWKGSIGLV